MSFSKVDWLGFRTKAPPELVRSTLERLFEDAGRVDLVARGKGSLGYQEAGSISLGGMTVGQYGTGGESQRGWSSFALSGGGCEWVRSWDAAVDELELLDYEIRRCDLAVDTYAGEVTHASVLKGYADGAFRCGVKQPSMRLIENFPVENGSTVYVGKRDQAKMFRGYEKGREQVLKYGSSFGTITHISADDGVQHPVEDWYRCEIELKAKDVALPVDLVEKRDEYFAGSYPFCRSLIEVEPFQLATARQRRPQLELSKVLENIQTQWGRSLFTAAFAYQGDIGAVWSKIVGRTHNDALIEAGVLLVDHD
jgi:phage replication initiation protein